MDESIGKTDRDVIPGSLLNLVSQDWVSPKRCTCCKKPDPSPPSAERRVLDQADSVLAAQIGQGALQVALRRAPGPFLFLDAQGDQGARGAGQRAERNGDRAPPSEFGEDRGGAGIAQVLRVGADADIAGDQRAQVGHRLVGEHRVQAEDDVADVVTAEQRGGRRFERVRPRDDALVYPVVLLQRFGEGLARLLLLIGVPDSGRRGAELTNDQCCHLAPSGRNTTTDYSRFASAPARPLFSGER